MIRYALRAAWHRSNRLLTQPHLQVTQKLLFSDKSGIKRVTDISGIYPPIATPFDVDGNLALDKLEQNIKKWNQLPLRGLAVLGSNGEVAYLSPDEKVTMVRRAREVLNPEKIIIGGAGCETTNDTINMCRLMAEAGADLVMVVTPCYYKGRMTNQVLENHYRKVADMSPVPVILYSVPGNTGIDLSPDVVIKLSSHPNIIGMKESGGDIVKISNMVYKTQAQDFQVLAGSAGFLLPALASGCVGGLCASANMLGQEICDLYELYKQGKHSEAQSLQYRLIGPNAAVTKMFGVPALKASMEWFGYYGGAPRLPMLPLNQDELEQVRNQFAQNGFLK